MVKIEKSRRKLIEITSTGAITLIAGCSGNNSSNGDSTNSNGDGNTDSPNSVIKSVENNFEQPAIEISVEPGEVDEVVLQNDGEVISSDSPSSTETKVVIPILDPEEIDREAEHRIIATKGGEIIDETTWTPPNVNISVPNVEAASFQFDHVVGIEIDVRIEAIPHISPSQAYISGGFPIEVHDKNKIHGESFNTSEKLVHTFVFSKDRGYGTIEHLIIEPPSRSCDGQTGTIEMTIEFEEAESRIINLESTFNGNIEPARMRNSNKERGISCSDTQIETTGTKTIE